MRTIQPNMLEIPGAKLNGKKTSEKKFPKNLGIPREEILENAVPFATGSCRKFKQFWLNGKRPRNFFRLNYDLIEANRGQLVLTNF